MCSGHSNRSEGWKVELVGVVRVLVVVSMAAGACDACYWLERVVASGGSAGSGDGGLSTSGVGRTSVCSNQ